MGLNSSYDVRAPTKTSQASPLTGVVTRVDDAGIWVVPLGGDMRTPIGPCRGTSDATQGAVCLLVFTQDQPWAYVGDDTTAPVTSVAGKTGAVTLTKDDVGLGSVDDTSDADKPVSIAAQAALDAKQDTSARGAANGYASLDGAGKVPVAQLPSAIMTYEGVWDAATNTPTLANSVGDTGQVYRVTVAGSRDLGAGAIDFQVGDYAIFNGTVWEKSDTTDAVASVAGLTGVITAPGLRDAISVNDVPTNDGRYVPKAAPIAADLNDCRTNGVYIVTSAATANSPISGYYGVCVVSAAASTDLVQEVTAYAQGSAAVRWRRVYAGAAGGWSAWTLQATNDDQYVRRLAASSGLWIACDAATYNESIPSGTGSIVIQTGLSFGNYMTRVHITGYSYEGTGQDIDLVVSFYAYSVGPAYANYGVVNLGNVQIQVDLARRASDNTVAIILTKVGPSTTWSYPKIVVDVVISTSSATTPPAAAMEGWTTSRVTDLTPWTVMVTPGVTVPGAIPVSGVYTTTVTTNPATLLGYGTWTSLGSVNFGTTPVYAWKRTA